MGSSEGDGVYFRLSSVLVISLLLCMLNLIDVLGCELCSMMLLGGGVMVVKFSFIFCCGMFLVIVVGVVGLVRVVVGLFIMIGVVGVVVCG